MVRSPRVVAAVLGVVIVAASIGAALALRFLLVEPADIAHRCDAAPWSGADCALRALTVQAFVHQRLGFAALVASGLALLLRSTTLAVVAAALAGAGLVLYGADRCAPAAVIALVAWVQATPKDSTTARSRAPGP